APVPDSKSEPHGAQPDDHLAEGVDQAKAGVPAAEQCVGVETVAGEGGETYKKTDKDEGPSQLSEVKAGRRDKPGKQTDGEAAGGIHDEDASRKRCAETQVEDV